MLTDLIELLYEWWKEIVYGPYKKGLLLAFSLSLAACESGSGSGATAPLLSPAPPPESETPIVITEKSGSGFTCFQLNLSGRGQIYCRGPATDARLGINSISYSLYAEDSNSNFTALEVWDDTVCFATSVLQRPFLGDAGPAVYCTGEANLGPNYSGYQYVVYSGPPFTHETHGSADLYYATLPFVGGEFNFTMDVLTNTGGNWLVMQDTSTTVTETDINCELSSDETALTCPTFTIEVQ